MIHVFKLSDCVTVVSVRSITSIYIMSNYLSKKVNFLGEKIK